MGIRNALRKLMRTDPGIEEDFDAWAFSHRKLQQALEPGTTITRTAPRDIHGNESPLFGKDREFATRDLECCVINNCVLTGIYGFIILPDGKYLLPYVNGVPENVLEHPDYFSHRARWRKKQLIHAPCVSLIGFWWHNCYHWICDTLCYWHLIKSFVPQHFKILLPSGLRNYHIDSLASCGFPIDRAIFIDANVRVQVEALWIAQHPWRSRWHLPVVTQGLRESMIKGLNLGRSCDKNRVIVVSREDASQRRLSNEAELLHALRMYDVQKVVPGKMTFAEQARTFASANIIIGPHGAGLTNILFCSPGATLIEIQIENEERPFYWSLSESLGLQYRFAKGVAQQGALGDMVICMDELTAIERFVNAIVSKETAS
jgi:hypothetical protein